MKYCQSSQNLKKPECRLIQFSLIVFHFQLNVRVKFFTEQLKATLNGWFRLKYYRFSMEIRENYCFTSTSTISLKLHQIADILLNG